MSRSEYYAASEAGRPADSSEWSDNLQNLLAFGKNRGKSEAETLGLLVVSTRMSWAYKERFASFSTTRRYEPPLYRGTRELQKLKRA